MRLEEGTRVTILDGSSHTGSIGKVVSHADGMVAVLIEKGVGRGWEIAVSDLSVGPVVQIDHKTLTILPLMAPESTACSR